MPASPPIHAPATSDRWQRAQAYERAWWESRGAIRLDYFEALAGQVRIDLAPFGGVDDASRVVEIGSGPAGLVTALPGARRAGIEPLEGYFAGVPEYRAFRDPAVEYHAASGEALPFEDGTFDRAVSDNVLDHCADPDRVLAEVHRVLEPGGLFWLRVHTYHGWGRLVREALERFVVDPGHPHTFTRHSLRAAVRAAGFEVRAERHGRYLDTWRRELTAGTRKDLAKALLFATRVDSLFVLRRP